MPLRHPTSLHPTRTSTHPPTINTLPTRDFHRHTILTPTQTQPKISTNSPADPSIAKRNPRNSSPLGSDQRETYCRNNLSTGSHLTRLRGSLRGPTRSQLYCTSSLSGQVRSKASASLGERGLPSEVLRGRCWVRRAGGKEGVGGAICCSWTVVCLFVSGGEEKGKEGKVLGWCEAVL